MMRIKKWLVIDANWPSMQIYDWASEDGRDKKCEMPGQKVLVGNWFHLKQGRRVEMEVLVGERPGGGFFCHLLVEQEGVEYRGARMAVRCCRSSSWWTCPRNWLLGWASSREPARWKGRTSAS